MMMNPFIRFSGCFFIYPAMQILINLNIKGSFDDLPSDFWEDEVETTNRPYDYRDRWNKLNYSQVNLVFIRGATL